MCAYLVLCSAQCSAGAVLKWLILNNEPVFFHFLLITTPLQTGWHKERLFISSQFQVEGTSAGNGLLTCDGSRWYRPSVMPEIQANSLSPLWKKVTGAGCSTQGDMFQYLTVKRGCWRAEEKTDHVHSIAASSVFVSCLAYNESIHPVWHLGHWFHNTRLSVLQGEECR